MLKSINKLYLLASILLYFILSPKVSGEYLLITLFAIFSFISYFTILYVNSSINVKFHTKTYLGIEVFIYSILFVAIQNLISYHYTNNFFMFSDSDAFTYHLKTIDILHMSFENAIKHYLNSMSFDDLGIILILYPLYHISESNLILNFFYLFVAVITALSIFRLSENFMTKKYAFLSSLSYSLSSFVLFFHSTGLKESFMVMLVVLSFDLYYKFLRTKNILNLIGALLFMGFLLLFRPAIAGMIIGSIGFGSLISKKGGISIKIISFFIFIFLIFMSDSIIAIIKVYTTGGFETLIYARESQGMIKGGITFTYAVNILAQAIGPLPTIISPDKILLAFYAPGLIYRVLLAFPFWFGIIYIYKTKSYKLYPLIIFVIMEMLALIFLMDGFELRKAIPHISIVFVIAFWFLDNYDRGIIRFQKRKRFNQFFKFSIFILIWLIFYWNFR